MRLLDRHWLRPTLKTCPARQSSRLAINARSRRQPTGLNTSKPLHPSQRPRVSQASTTPLFSFITTRFNSTDSTPRNAGQTTVVTPSTTGPVPPTASYEEVLNNINTTEIPSLPNQIGYLKSLGLDYGWGPTSMMEWVVEHIHVYTGGPWWISIALTAIALRAVLFKAYVGASDTAARTAALKPATAPIMAKIRECQLNRDTAGLMLLRGELSGIYKRANIQTWRQFLPFIQIFPGFGMFRLMRGMADVPVPGLDDGGVWWARDLTVPDPFYLMPAVASYVMYRVFKSGGETGAGAGSMISPTLLNIMTYGLPCITFTFMIFWPGTLQVYFFCTGMLTALQTFAFRNATIRRWLGMAPLIVHKEESKETAISPAGSGLMNLNLTPRSKAAVTASGASPVLPDAATEAKPKGIVGGAVSEIKGVASEVKKTWDKVKGTTNKPGQRTDEAKRQAKAYEMKRRKELEKERWAKQEQRREERARREEQEL
ncbi:MAG: Mitochondrial inner membrane protein oxa1 [Watsoniomyces obsoletus]|nr:MAG: Mitochondrial inner membrane protein oxa1 [Watsoniomyces obsoletus]